MKWHQYSKKATSLLERPRYVGAFAEQDAIERGMRLVIGRLEHFCIYWLVDETDGVIADAKYQVIGPTPLIAALESASELVMRKTYSQAARLSADLLESHLRDRKETPSLPDEAARFFNEVIDAMELAARQCQDIQAAASYDETPIEELEGGVGIAGWEELSDERKLQILEEVTEKEIRPYIELDAGGVEILGLRDNGEVRIAYRGSCTTCHSSTGSTLSAIQRILRSRVHPGLTVVPVL